MAGTYTERIAGVDIELPVPDEAPRGCELFGMDTDGDSETTDEDLVWILRECGIRVKHGDEQY